MGEEIAEKESKTRPKRLKKANQQAPGETKTRPVQERWFYEPVVPSSSTALFSGPPPYLVGRVPQNQERHTPLAAQNQEGERRHCPPRKQQAQAATTEEEERKRRNPKFWVKSKLANWRSNLISIERRRAYSAPVQSFK
jgi:hypothetical protein